MFLKSLEIFGFKSFADRVRIEFSDGITALLGPNGCGKSNVVDAVKWVLGEQAAKTMRADKMEDVIFNGTEARKPLNVAEVTLTIANEQGVLPLDVSEIMIKRRLYRSGESEYYINNNQVKLKDVRELFWDTGVGKAAYSVMEQGKIDQILSSKPEDRRYLFEEAAGITRFKVKRAEAERKLERVEENMKQVDGILGEVKRSYDSLKIQSDKTIAYRKLKDDIFGLERDIQLLRLKNYTQDRDNRNDDLKSITQKRDNARQEINDINLTVAEHMDEVNSMQTKLISMNQTIFGLATEQKGKQEQSKILYDRQNEIKTKINQLESRKKNLTEQVENLQEEVDEQQSGLHDLNKRIAEIANNIKSFEDNIDIASTQITQNDKTAVDYENQINTLDEKRSELQMELASITENIVKELDAKLKETGYSMQSSLDHKNAITDVLKQCNIVLTGRKQIVEDFSSLKNPKESEISNYIKVFNDFIIDIEDLLKKLDIALNDYFASSPDFIEEFLSPEGIVTKKRNIDTKISDNKQAINKLKKQIDDLKAENLELVDKINEYRETLEKMRINQAQINAQIQASEDHLKLLRRELATNEAALAELENEFFTENKRFEEVKEQVIELEDEIASLEHKGRVLTKELQDLEKEISSKNKDVSGKQDIIQKKTKELGKYQEQLEKLNMDLVSSDTEIKNLKENFRDNYSRDLMEFEERMFTITETPMQLKDDLAKVRQLFKELGNVNLMAPEEFQEIKERYEFLNTQIADLQKAREDLKRITDEIKAESTELFLSTYNKIKKNFHNMFRRLFGGGRAELKLVDPQNVLESGVDIFAQPSGKKLENITLLSGGEKTMTAVALLFATYMVRPSPFCLLDEIDAALDDPNVDRLVHTLRDFANVSQYIVITHNRKTVIGASTMLGVTMEEFGVSKIITMRLGDEDGKITLPEPEIFEEEDVEPETDVFIPPHPPKRHKEVNDTTEITDNKGI